jgi:hypothetical protein
MLKPVNDPEMALLTLGESLLIRFCYDPDVSIFTIVCDYWDKEPGSDRAFVKLVFCEVTDYNREAGDQLGFRKYIKEYSLNEAKAPLVIQDIATESIRNHSKKADFWFGPSFGGLSFSYQSCCGQILNTRAIKDGDSYQYYDLETGARLDFYNPFNDL